MQSIGVLKAGLFDGLGELGEEFVEGGFDFGASGAGVSTATELLGEFGDVDGVGAGLGAEAESDLVVFFVFGDEDDDLNGTDDLGEVDEAFGFGHVGAGFFEVGGAK